MKNLFLIALLSIMSLCNSCLDLIPTKYDVNYVNNESFDLYYYVAFGYGSKNCYPDTTIFFKSPDGQLRPRSYVIDANWEPIEAQIKRYNPSDTLSIYYFHPDTLAKHSWEEIQQGYKILRRYDLSIEDIHLLKNKNDVPEIPYPPTEAMKNMKMYPPYGQYCYTVGVRL
jgi:hypothetical protein